LASGEIKIGFEWWRDPDGYCIKKTRLAKGARAIHYNHPGKNVPLLPRLKGQIGFVYHPLGVDVLPGPLDSHPQRILQSVVRCGGKLQSYRPIDHFDNLFAFFARDVKDSASVLEFIKTYGPLTPDGLDPRVGELADGVIAHASAMRNFLRGDAAGGAASLEFNPGEGIPMADVGIKLITDQALQVPKLQFNPKSLLDGMWIQVAQKITSGVSIGACTHCGLWFAQGGRKGRRRDSKFCSDEHRIAFNSLKRTKEK
jgi:hypothetical protein